MARCAIWTVVPASMMEAKSVMLESVNSIVGFLNSGASRSTRLTS
jgi:hypothetical protein